MMPSRTRREARSATRSASSALRIDPVLPTRGAARYTGGLWAGMFVKTVSYQEVTDQDSSTLLGEVCGRASRVELFEGHARAGDIRATKYRGNALPWAPEQARRWTAERAATVGR